MLRVLATHYTSALSELRRLLMDLGLVPGEEGDGWAVLDAHSGRVRLRTAERGSARDGATVFGVEVRDAAEFARRTADDGGRAALEETPAGARVRITGPDGFEFLAEPTEHAGRYVDADPDLTVRLEWVTRDADGAAATLAAIGGRPRGTAADEATGAREFTAKNGGVLAAVPADADTPRSGGLTFEYAGNPGELSARLALAGWNAVGRTREGHMASRYVPDAPGGAGDASATAPAGGDVAGVVRLSIAVPDGSEVTILMTGRHTMAAMR